VVNNQNERVLFPLLDIVLAKETRVVCVDEY